jgi:hypothetical protein
MSFISIITILSLTLISGTTASSIFQDGYCITIFQDDKIMYERQSHEGSAGYLYLATRKYDQPYQKWILERNETDLYNLRNKNSNLTVEDYFYSHIHYLKTTNYRSKTMQFKFEPKGNRKYSILTRHGVRATSDSDGYIRLPHGIFQNGQIFTILSCTPTPT